MTDPETVLAAEPDVRPADAGHPFARFVRAVGRGIGLGRSLDELEAAEAMGMILAGAVEPVQVGAFLVVLRYRKETPEELAGFVRAARAAAAMPAGATADLDWPSYADRHRRLPYFVLAALLLAENGVRVLMHGIAGEGDATTPKALDAMAIAPATTAGEAARHLDRSNFAYLPLANFCPPLEGLFGLRPLLGVRSPANTFARALNPFAAAHQIQGVFHPTYLATHRDTARLLGQPRLAAFKGGGGEVQRNPEKPCRLATLADGVAGEETWPALTPGERHPWREEPLEPERVAALWRGEWAAPGPVAAIIGTAAIALKLLGRAASIEAAEEAARALWAERNTGRFG